MTPPPSTLSSSETPVGWCLVVSVGMLVMGTAAEAGATARTAPSPPMEDSTAVSLTLPQVPQSGQRPTHLAVVCWHSEHLNCARGLATPRR
jgi:hypothetical protein